MSHTDDTRYISHDSHISDTSDTSDTSNTSHNKCGLKDFSPPLGAPLYKAPGWWKIIDACKAQRNEGIVRSPPPLGANLQAPVVENYGGEKLKNYVL